MDTYDRYDRYDRYDDSDNLDGYYGSTQKFTNYEELLSLSKHEDTKYTIKNILFALMKVVVQLKCKEVSFKVDFALEPYQSWIDIAEVFNTKYVGTDYRILIDEDDIVCVLLN